MSDAMTPQQVAEYAVWYARKVKGPAAEVARRLLEEDPWLREPLEAAALSSPETTPAGVLDEAALREALTEANQIIAMTRDHLARDHPECAYTVLGIMNDSSRVALSQPLAERLWPTRDEFRRMAPAEVNRFLESIGVSTRVVDPATPAGVLDEAWAAAEKALPEGATLSVSSTRAVTGPYVAVTDYGPPRNGFAYADSPAAALHALAAALGRSGSGGGRG